MGGATIWPVPRAVDAEAHYYPRKWKRNMLFLYGGALLIGLQVQRYAAAHRVSNPYIIRLGFILTHAVLFLACSNQRCVQENTWTGEARTLPRESGSTEQLTLSSCIATNRLKHHSALQDVKYLTR